MPTPPQLEPYLFKPGNKCGAAHAQPTATKVALLRREMINVVTKEDMHEMTARMVAIVKTGKPKDAIDAFALLQDRIFGKARETLDVNLAERQPIPMDQYSDDQIRTIIAVLETPACKVSSVPELPAPITADSQVTDRADETT